MEKIEKAVFAGGCFWCMQPVFDSMEGVISTRVGYSGGTQENPAYEEVCSGKTGHTEAIQIEYDPSKAGYQELLEVFWQNIDPTTPNQQFADVGTQYRTAIFYQSDEQKRVAEESKKQLEQSGRYQKPIVTEIVPASLFYPAEDYHQRYYKKNPVRYQLYKKGSGRESYLKRVWGD